MKAIMKKILDWMLFFDRPAVLASAMSNAHEILDRHDVPNPDKAPEDLQDRHGSLLTDSEGYSLAGRILIKDLVGGGESLPAYLAKIVLGQILGALVFLVPSILSLVMSPNMTTTTATIWCAALIISLGLRMYEPVLVVTLCAFIAGSAGTTGIDSFILLAVLVPAGASLAVWALSIISNLVERWQLRDIVFHDVDDLSAQARTRQAEFASADTSPFLKIGKATGILRKTTMDIFAPDADKEMGLSADRDISTHLMVCGGTGSGKTSKVFKPLLKQWVEKTTSGLLVLDGKGQLPAEMSEAIKDMVLLTPDSAVLNPIEGLTPEDVTEVLSHIQGAANDKDPTWQIQGERLMYYAGILLEAASTASPDPGRAWTLYNLSRAVNEEAFREDLITIAASVDEAKDSVAQTELLLAAINYFRNDFNRQPKAFQGSVLGTTNAWLGPLLAHREIAPWTRAATGVQVEEVLTGARLGLCLPGFRYGSAGRAITALTKLRLYRAIQRRGDAWRSDAQQKPVLLAIDEAPAVVSQVDTEISAVARSLGLAIIVGLQDVAQIDERFGESGGQAFRAQFLSLIFLRSSSESVEWLKEHIGQAQMLIENEPVDNINLVGTAQIQMRSQAAKINPGFALGATVGKITKSLITQALGKEENYSTFERKNDYLLDPATVQTHLATPDVAFAQLMRGGVPRRDFIILG